MRILIINTSLTGKNGISNVIFNYLRVVDHNVITFDYITKKEPEKFYIEEVERYGGHVYVLPRDKKNLIKNFINYIRIVKAGKYHAVHIHTSSHTSVYELIVTFLAGCKNRIVHSHNTECNSVIVHKLLTPVFRLLCTHRLACGCDAGRWMFGTDSFTVLNNGVDTNIFAFNPDVRANMRIDHGKADIIIGHVGTFNKAKNQSFLVEVFNSLRKKNLNYKLVMIGDGAMREKVEEQVNSYSLSDSVVFTGNVDNVEDYLNMMDIIVMPSLYEGLPLTLIEQQANGLQCICSDSITNEVDKTGNLFFLPLNKGADFWAEFIHNVDLGKNRQFTSQKAVMDIKSKGYSIQEEGKKLTSYYKSLS